MKDSLNRVLGMHVKVIIDRPLGSYHPEHKDLYYPINYGYIEGILAADQEEQASILWASMNLSNARRVLSSL